ncbi:DUF2505 domain-containing protein [Nocardia sp. 2]|uniref:DUF2505 domain-containing protein n=1 Tax=Nocardia acididurans TaxID=2802282 RepID=A0ABS1M0U1_9NOCA|nr:DUF2505 domain-containing protein [Nocardia acididurans]MBL1074293.1 DUF2505 domain-containing protein [Nocardia acididurans]
MSRTFSGEYTFRHPVEAVHGALSSRVHWEQRVAELGEQRATLTGFSAANGITTVEVTNVVAPHLLPRAAAKYGDITVQIQEEWHALVGDAARGVMRGRVTAARVQTDGVFGLRANGADGCVLSLTGTVVCRLPMVGKAVEAGLEKAVTEGFGHNCEFIEQWVDRQV